ncbi:hypothetical protein M378DRAFT_171410 [Amanita muscaria Koide BX008]|uniref:Uncharacterized protein n=1 Tax=Amanita muscaria (strain Koide BX008) TaxID=946122 RepID=A0A0C2WN94_AMAMK|nr:hypothetical protein M378DRAFT_171410 [Amanita muscaria Koide BX008]
MAVTSIQLGWNAAQSAARTECQTLISADGRRVPSLSMHNTVHHASHYLQVYFMLHMLRL